MNEGEIIHTIYIKFNDIIVGLRKHGKRLQPDELNRNLASISIECKPKVTTKEFEDYHLVTMGELLGSFITYEHTLEKDNKGKIQCFEGKSYRHMKHKWPK